MRCEGRYASVIASLNPFQHTLGSCLVSQKVSLHDTIKIYEICFKLEIETVSADSDSAVDVRRNAGRRDGHAAGTFADQSAALDSDGAVGETAAVVWQPAHRRHLQVPAHLCDFNDTKYCIHAGPQSEPSVLAYEFTGRLLSPTSTHH